MGGLPWMYGTVPTPSRRVEGIGTIFSRRRAATYPRRDAVTQRCRDAVTQRCRDAEVSYLGLDFGVLVLAL